MEKVKGAADMLVFSLLIFAGCGGGSGNDPGLQISILEPSTPVAAARGASVQIEYADDDPQGTARTSLYADGDGDLGTTADRVAIELDRPVGDGSTQAVLWNTTGVQSGSYVIVAITADGSGRSVTAMADGAVTLNTPPTASVTEPSTDVTIRNGELIRVEYVDDDPDDDALTDLYADADGDLSTTSDRHVIAAGRPEMDGATQFVDWDTAGIPNGSYFVVAVTSDGVGAPAQANSSAVVTVRNPGGAIELLGDGGHIAFAEALIGDRTTFTFECWIKPYWPPNVGAPNSSRNNIYGETKALDGVRHEIQVLSHDPQIPGHELGAITCSYWVSPDVVEVFTEPVHESRWQHVAVVGDAGELRLFVDGALQDEGAAQSYSGPAPDVFRIGNAFNRNWGRFVIDDVRVSSTARYAANFEPELVHLADAETLSLWHFDEPSGSSVVDAAGNLPDGALSATAVRVTADRYAVQSIFDRFEDGQIDTTAWEILEPFAGSSAIESGGTLNLSARPYVATRDEWLPDENAALVVEFDWIPETSISHLNLLTRSDATWAGQYAESDGGVGVNFSVQQGSFWGYSTQSAGGVPGLEFGTHSYSFVPGSTYRIRLVDDGTSLTLYINDMKAPVAVGTVSDEFATNRVVFYNREFGAVDAFDNFRISGRRVVREP